MNKEARDSLREELKLKGVSSGKIAEVLEGLNENIKDAIAEAKRDKADVRHGTSCIGIIRPGAKKPVVEF